ncbi:hypothetical protein NQ317_003328 [Molorchus minor]|uniref:GH16 domain-containing protein n=1 Tax=Molorchus minor TaxID=1323400 RepID=A0ABQ9J0I7_9CUCU|nr:hypothetical protein NQ317_003328 [Molorchus minor]
MNWEFEYYLNNRTNSYADDGILHIKPTLLADETGEEFLTSGTLELYGGAPADQCTNAAQYGCSRTGSPENIINPIKSARIRTVDSFSFMYGKAEVRAKVPSGDWLWPAIWFLPRWNQYSGWPVSGEIDLMESRGNLALVNDAGTNIGAQQVGSTLHWGPNYNYNRYPYTHFEQNNAAGYNTDFHNYQLEWTQDTITFSVDDVVIGTVQPPEGGFWELGELDATGLQNPWTGGSKMAPFDQEFYIIINLAIGGTNYFPDNAINPSAKPWLNTSPTAAADFWRGKDQWYPTWHEETTDSHLQVDYVKIWAL